MDHRDVMLDVFRQRVKEVSRGRLVDEPEQEGGVSMLHKGENGKARTGDQVNHQE